MSTQAQGPQFAAPNNRGTHPFSRDSVATTCARSSQAQILANQLNALASSGPRTPEGKARVAQNSVTLGLFASRDLVRPEEQSEYDELRAALEAELLPATVMERTHAMEILHATWRLRRCAVTEAGLDPAEHDATSATQLAIDRARAHARNNLRRASADLSRLQTERHLKSRLESDTPDTAETMVSHQSVVKTLAHDARRRLNLRKLEDLDTFESLFARAAAKISSPITKQTQFPAGPPPPEAAPIG